MAVITSIVYGGASGHFMIADNCGANVRGSHTIMGRVKWTVTTTNEHYYPIALVTSTGTSGTFVGRVSGDSSTVSRGGRRSTTPTYNTVSDTGSFGDTTTWRHFAVVYDSGTQIAEYYIDGVSQGTISSTTTLVGTDTSGAFIIIGKCKVADACVYSRALSSSEVAQMADTRAISVTSGLLAFWRMDTNSSGGTAEGNATDTSGNGRTLVLDTSLGGTACSYSTADNPPQPDYYIANSGSCSTSGTAAVTLVYSAASSASVTTSGAATLTKGAPATSAGSTSTAGAVTATAAAPVAASSSTSTSGTAAVGTATALAGTGSATTQWTWADVVRAGGQAYRLPVAAALNNGTDTGPSAAAPRSVCVWMRMYALQPSLNSTQIGVLGTGGAASTFFALGGVINSSTTARAFYNLTVGASQASAFFTVDHDWHHLALTYDGTNFRFYIDSVLIDGPTAFSIPFDDTAWYSDLFTGVGERTDLAHFKIWANYTLSAGEVSSEMTNYRPVTAIASLRAYYPLLWDNPGWDGSGHGYDISGLTHALDDAPNGPPGTWPPSTASGNTSTAGTAAVGLGYGFASAGSTATSGTAAVGISYAVAASSSTQTAGTASVTPAYELSVSGQTSAAGAVAASASAPLAASAQTSTSGAATVSANTGYDAASSGQTATSGSVAMTAAASIAATGQTVAGPNSGSYAGTLICTSDTASSGTAEFGSAEFPATSSGQTSTAGAALVAIEFPLSAAGATSANGAAALVAAANISATGTTSTDGAARFTLIAGGLSQTSGAASVAASAAVTATGSTATTGAAALGLGIIPGGLTATSGAATMTASAPLQATGSCLTFGSAVFDGAVPSTGGGAGRPIADRRMLGALGIRRKIR